VLLVGVEQSQEVAVDDPLVVLPFPAVVGATVVEEVVFGATVFGANVVEAAVAGAAVVEGVVVGATVVGEVLF